MHMTQRHAFVLFGIALLIYSLPLAYNALVTPFFHIIPSQDVVSTSLLPVSILTRGNFYLDQYRKYIANNYPEPYFVDEVNQHLVSRYPVAASILPLPFIGAGLGTGWIARTVNVFDVARFSAAFLTALAGVAFFFCARELTDRATSTLVAIAFAFGTSIWATASQGLWQHTPSVLFQSIALWFLLRGKRLGAHAIAPAGMFFSLAFVSRPTTVASAIIFSIYVLVEYRQALGSFLAWAIPPVLLFMLYNYAINGSPFVFGYQEGVASQFGFPQWEAINGLLFSTGRGLFIYSPFLALAPVGLWIGWIREQKNIFVYFALAFIAYTGIMAAWGSLGGWAYGSRMLTDTLPVICLLIIPAVEKIRGSGRVALWVVVVLAAFVQSLGLYDYGVNFHADPANNVWSLQNSEPVHYLKLYFSMIQDTLGL